MVEGRCENYTSNPDNPNQSQMSTIISEVLSIKQITTKHLDGNILEHRQECLCYRSQILCRSTDILVCVDNLR